MPTKLSINGDPHFASINKYNKTNWKSPNLLRKMDSIYQVKAN